MDFPFHDWWCIYIIHRSSLVIGLRCTVVQSVPDIALINDDTTCIHSFITTWERY